MSVTMAPRKKEGDPIEDLRKQVEKQVAAHDALDRVIAEKQIVVDYYTAKEQLPRVLAELAEAQQQIGTARDEATAILTTAHADAEAIRGRGRLDADALVAEAKSKASEIVSAAERRGAEIVETARQQRERDLEVSNSRINTLERQAQAVLQRVQATHKELLDEEQATQERRKVILERSR